MERSKWWVWIRVVGDINNGIRSVRDYYEGMSRGPTVIINYVNMFNLPEIVT